MNMSKQHLAVEVSASSAPTEVISAIVTSATAGPAHRVSNPNRWLIAGFFFVIIFASIIYFREEIYTFTKDVHKYPILSAAEALQVRQYVGSQWTFGVGKDAVKGLDTAAAPALTATPSAQ